MLLHESYLFWHSGNERGGTVGWSRWQILEESNSTESRCPQAWVDVSLQSLALTYIFFPPRTPKFTTTSTRFHTLSHWWEGETKWIVISPSYGINVPSYLLQQLLCNSPFPPIGKKKKISSSSYTLNFLVQKFHYGLWWTCCCFLLPCIIKKLFNYFSCMLLLLGNLHAVFSWKEVIQHWARGAMHVYCLLVSKASPKYVYKCSMVYIALKIWACIVPFFLIESI